MNFVFVTPDNKHKAIDLAHLVFGSEPDDPAKGISDTTHSWYWMVMDEMTQTAQGVIGLYAEDFDESEALWLGWFAVHPEARGKGLGTSLLRFAEDQALQRGKKFLRVFTDDEADVALPMYRRYGFVDMRKPDVARPYFHGGEIFLEKQISDNIPT
ncbi:GNAT family N-acetyltransferase [Candidatus Gracilibacteria bacterium]|nr:GNAT family N-acetyltransferase [Candidatus Gracilibacteria bacterium]